MMRKIINVGYAAMPDRIKALLSTVICLFSLCLLAPSALADYYYLKPGQSKTISTPAGLDTIFVSNPRVADYKIIGSNKVVIYGREAGYSDITLYDAKSGVLAKYSLEVDPLLADVLSRIKTIYPTSKVRISKVSGIDAGKSTVYILSGTVPTEEALDTVYRIVGQAAASEFKDWSTPTPDVKTTSGGGSGSGNSGELDIVHRRAYENVINRLTIPQTNQVNVRLTVVEVNKEFKDNLGIEWSNMTTGTNGMFSLTGFKGLNRPDIHNVIQALQNDTIARVLAQPNLTVLSGKVATFLVGGEIPITVRDTTNNSVSVQYKEYGIILSVAAKVESSNKIKLTLGSELSSVEGNNEIPRFKTRRATSTIEIADGDSFAIAGLLNEQDIESLSKVPFIGDIPILGAIARNAQTSRSKTELIIFATVNLVKPTNSSANIELPSFKKTSTSKLFFNVGVNKQAREDRLNKNTQLNHDSEVFLSRGGFAK